MPKNTILGQEVNWFLLLLHFQFSFTQELYQRWLKNHSCTCTFRQTQSELKYRNTDVLNWILIHINLYIKLACINHWWKKFTPVCHILCFSDFTPWRFSWFYQLQLNIFSKLCKRSDLPTCYCTTTLITLRLRWWEQQILEN